MKGLNIFTPEENPKRSVGTENIPAQEAIPAESEILHAAVHAEICYHPYRMRIS